MLASPSASTQRATHNAGAGTLQLFWKLNTLTDLFCVLGLRVSVTDHQGNRGRSQRARGFGVVIDHEEKIDTRRKGELYKWSRVALERSIDLRVGLYCIT